jgi:phage terminase large subunit-like protein
MAKFSTGQTGNPGGRPRAAVEVRDLARKHTLSAINRLFGRTWLLLAGRGFGKTRTGAEWVRSQIETLGRRRIALVAPTAADARDIMISGESGLLAVGRKLNHRHPVRESAAPTQ